jgi:hypothetical protein
MQTPKVFFILLFLSCISCSNDSQDKSVQKANHSNEELTYLNDDLDKLKEKELNKASSNGDEVQNSTSNKNVNYDRLHKLIIYGKADFADIRKALTDKNEAALTNTVHALYAMRSQRTVSNLLFDLWNMEKDKYPELSWNEISKAPSRIALASTINRIQVINTDEYKDYIRSFKNDDNEFHIAQVVISLGFNGSPDDIEYIKEKADGDNHYVAQSAITALAIMGGNQARDAMIELAELHENSPRGDLIKTLLKQTYNWPSTSNDIFDLEKAKKDIESIH